jgi:alpha-L-arabinofuranosidase
MLFGAVPWFGSTIDQEIEIFPDEQIGVIHPDLHGQFIEHPDNFLAPKNPNYPGLTGYREIAIAYLRSILPPVVRGPAELTPFLELIGARPYRGGPATLMDPVTEDAILHLRRSELVIQTNGLTAVAAAVSLNVFHRQADKVSVGLAPMKALLIFKNQTCTPTGVYYAFLLAKPHRANISVKASPPQANPLELSISASRRDNSFVITIVNPKPDRNVRIRCIVNSRQVTAASATTLFRQRLDVQVRPEGMLVTLPALSVTTILAQAT